MPAAAGTRANQAPSFVSPPHGGSENLDIDHDDYPQRYHTLSNLLGDDEVPGHAIHELVDGKLHLQVSEELANFKEAESHARWLAAMQVEMDSILENHTWHLTDLPADFGLVRVGNFA
ncbi:hypothetical protein E2562_031964 [Oryza meyeriana var. granulata]|uniref:Uncharacterized protein n=1 Tax=Oryza meyeriana var. granulata TaxID=110450 RepID=A0A6G1ERV1_9ORYZ|nr:hypothetical protein E2562_031964 [Oryza meyeriana var. granulata]